MRHGCDNIARDHCVRQHAEGPPRLSRRSWTPTPGTPMGFLLSGPFASVGMGDGLAIPGSVTTLRDHTRLARRDFFGSPVLRGSTLRVCPSTGPLGLAYNIRRNARAALALVF